MPEDFEGTWGDSPPGINWTNLAKKQALWGILGFSGLLLGRALDRFLRERPREAYIRAWWSSLHPAERWFRWTVGHAAGVVNRAAGRLAWWCLEPDQETMPEAFRKEPPERKCGLDDYFGFGQKREEGDDA